jgi:hypothetical protein
MLTSQATGVSASAFAGWGGERGIRSQAQERGSELRFEVNGQMFFVNFIPEEGRWYCFAPTATGMQKVPVSMDASPFESYTVSVDEQMKDVVN